jgi:hypothetical protein
MGDTGKAFHWCWMNGDLDDCEGEDARDLLRGFIDEFRSLRKIPIHGHSETIGYYHGA